MSVQLPLQFEFQSNQNFSTFYPGNNEEIITHLQSIFLNGEQQIFLWANPGAGKTHLLHAICQEAKNHSQTSFYFSLNANKLPDLSVLEGLENLDIVCFDNVEQIAGNTEWEQAFFNFFNLHRDAHKKLIVSAPYAPKFLAIQLPDLKTRMSWGLTLRLKSLTDEQRLNALIYKANDLGFEIPINVGRFLITHYARDLPSIWSLLDEIDHATLAAKRNLTIPFLKQIMKNKASQ